MTTIDSDPQTDPEEHDLITAAEPAHITTTPTAPSSQAARA